MKFEPNYFDFNGKTLLLTGASGYLGSLIASIFGRCGANLVLIDRNSEGLSLLSEKLVGICDGSVNEYVCDLSDLEQRADIIKIILERNSSGIDILINNAALVGTSDLEGWCSGFSRQSMRSWREALEVNVTAPFELCQALASGLQKNHGSVINVSSIYGSKAPKWSMYTATTMSNPAAYGVAKAALDQSTKWLASVLAPSVRVNSIAPGGIYRGQPTEFVNRYCELTPMGRMATEEDLIGTFLFLASNLSSYITGQTIVVDGGWSI